VALVCRAVEISILSLTSMIAFRPYEKFYYRCRIRTRMGHIVEIRGRSAARKRSKTLAQQPQFGTEITCDKKRP
jgi:hypothetical protein